MKKITITVTLLIICLSFINSYSQDYYSKVYYTNFHETLQSISITNTYDDAFVVSGIRNSENLLFKIDEDGNILWDMWFGDYQTPSNKVITLSDSNFLFVGSKYDPIYGYPLLLCVKFNTYGDTIWTSYIDMGTTFVAESVVESVESGYLVVGHTKFMDAPYSKMGIIKLTENGSLDWAKELMEGNANNNATDVVQSPEDSSYYITGVTESSGKWGSKGCLIKLDVSGEIEFSNYYFSAYGLNNSSLYNLLLDGDSLVITMSAGSESIIKTNLNGLVGNSRKYDGWGNMCVFDIHSGMIKKPNDSTYTMMSFNTVFNLSTDLKFRHSNFFWMCTSGFTNNGSDEFIVIGNGPILGVAEKIPYDPQIGIANLSMDGVSYELCSEFYSEPYSDTITINSEPLFFEVEGVGEQAYSSIDINSFPIDSQIACVAFLGATDDNPDQQFRVFPSPTSGIINIEAVANKYNGMIFVKDMQGRTVHQVSKTKGNTKLDLSLLPDGMYLIIINSETTESHRIIILR